MIYTAEYRMTNQGKVYGFFADSEKREIGGLFADMEHREYISIRGNLRPVTGLFTTSKDFARGFVVDTKAGEKMPVMFRDLTNAQLKRLADANNLPLGNLEIILKLSQDAAKTPNRA